MKYLRVIILALISLMAVESFGQKVTTRSSNQRTDKTKVKVGAFGEIIETKKETKENLERVSQKQTKYYDFVDENSTVCGDVEDFEEEKNTAESVNLMDVMVTNERNPLENQAPQNESLLFHSAKEITNESGFFILLVESNDILKKEHRIYQEFGNLRVKSNSESNYNYLIGKFLTKEIGDQFLNDIILSRYPEAKLVKLSEGEISNDIN